MSDLTKRWVVALVGVPTVIGLLYLGGWPLAIPVAVLAALAALECNRMAARGGIVPLPGVGAIGAAAFVLAAAWRPTLGEFAPVALTLLLGMGAVALVGAIWARGPEEKPLAAMAVTLFGSVYAGLPMAFVPLLHGLAGARGWTGDSAWGPGLVVALPLAATWLGDAVALYTGSAWGKGGLAPSVSPNKSWVGVWGGLGGAATAAAIWFVIAEPRLPGLPVPGLVGAALVGALLGIAAIFGDLAESLMKRDAGVKDSGTFFPGHGGVLDRLDALVLSIPVAYFALVILELLL